jgi:hypothetical protein
MIVICYMSGPYLLQTQAHVNSQCARKSSKILDQPGNQDIFWSSHEAVPVVLTSAGHRAKKWMAFGKFAWPIGSGLWARRARGRSATPFEAIADRKGSGRRRILYFLRQSFDHRSFAFQSFLEIKRVRVMQLVID